MTTRKLPNQGKTEQGPLKIAQSSVASNTDTTVTKPGLDELDITVKFKIRGERLLAKKLLDQYKSDYTIETVSEKNALQEVIYLEVVQLRLQEKLNDLYDEDTKALPFNILDIIHKNSDAIVKLKSTLGLNKSKDRLNAYDALEHLKKRFGKWREENQASRTAKCPYCEKLILWKMRTAAWDLQKHPFFKDNTLYNKALFSHLGQTVTINREFIASVLEVSPDYIDWMLARTQHTGEINVQPTLPQQGVTDGEEETSGQEKEVINETVSANTETATEEVT